MITIPQAATGAVIDGKYRIDRMLGAGGLGVVVAATHLQLDRPVALKFLAPQALSSNTAVERFQREARAAARLKSEHVARVLDVGTLPDGAPYIVMELLEGCDLSALLAERGRLDYREALHYLLQACEAMAEAHAAGIVHRDLKPANLFLTHDPAGAPIIKVLDFGIAKTKRDVAGSDHALTSTVGVMGSPLYMSPEQLESARDVDLRTDVWALGAILYELLTGEPPFSASSFARLCTAILNETPRPPSQVAPGIPPALDAVVMRCLDKNRDARFASVAELAAALGAYAPDHLSSFVGRIGRVTGSNKPAPVSENAVTVARGEATLQSWGQSQSAPRRSSRRWPWVVGAVGAAGAIATIAFLAGRRAEPGSLPVPSATQPVLASTPPLATQSAATPPALASAPPPASATSTPSAAPPPVTRPRGVAAPTKPQPKPKPNPPPAATSPNLMNHRE